ncbi:hypothetical protein GCM10010168_86910 [Actinoplanes ianthinogenes]|uniref:Uncharacterized protein n=1 Tax=Actinoplanes ianthinogenes TaxID=122358 RepID=A0ABM7LSR3_9ACTN|nr:hypothetical protein Aiant_29670 [Actinoplanes ianthinogenes]GGR54567.1 hypothetical protein GCM10010168_86910 [Actinoplanes ianthinogenes]
MLETLPNFPGTADDRTTDRPIPDGVGRFGVAGAGDAWDRDPATTPGGELSVAAGMPVRPRWHWGSASNRGHARGWYPPGRLPGRLVAGLTA